jgi:patatin-like phospholipase/acyl hydrolase
VLADYFDLVAGTSTGAIIAACVATGMPVAKIREFYETSGRDMFDPAFVLKRLYYKYDDDNLTRKLQSELGGDTKLGDAKLKRC